MPGKTLYCLGEAWLELNSTAPLASAKTFSPRMGGSAASLALAYAAQGGRASLLTQLGEDAFGHRIADALSTAGVDISRVGSSSCGITGGSGGSCSRGSGRSSSAVAGATAGGQCQSSGGNTGCCQKAATRNLLHDKILLRFSSFRAVRSARVAHRPFIYCTHFSKNFKSEQGLMKNVLFFKKM